jgi:hypothetical protein
MTAAEKRAAERAAYEKYIAEDTAGAAFARQVAEILPKSQIGKVVAIAQLFDAEFVSAAGVEVVGAHIATERVEYPNAVVGVDAAGNFVSVETDEPLLVLIAEDHG